MNTIRKLGLCFCLLCGLLLPLKQVQASEAGYYYQHIDVDVVVNEKREFQITETLHVYYEEEMHGILRTIPTSSEVEDYQISDIHVEGAPFTVEEDYTSVDVRIGDPEQTVKGEMTYVLRYTLTFYQDYDQSADYIYLNLIGDDFDTYTEKLSARIEYPENAVFEKCTVTEGRYGSRKNRKITTMQQNNVLFFESTNSISPYEAVTVQIQLAQGTFNQALEYVFPYEILSKQIDIAVDKQQIFTVNQVLLIQVNEIDCFYSLDLTMSAFNNHSDVDIQNFQGLMDGRQLTSMHSVWFDTLGQHEIQLSYQLYPRRILNGDLDFKLVDEYDQTIAEALHFKIEMPQVTNYAITYQRRNDALDPDRYVVTQEETALTFDSVSRLQAKERAIITIFFDEKDYQRPIPLSILGGTGFCFSVMVIIILLRMTRYRNRPLITPVTFYPPNGINSAEAGYLIDNHLTAQDMTSLIFYWASLGALRITDIQGKFKLDKLDSLPQERPAYEKRLFVKLFNHGIDNHVEEEDLKHSFYYDINQAKQAIIHKYKKEFPLIEQKSKTVSKICRFIALSLPVLMLALIQYQDTGSLFFSIFISVTMSIPLYFLFFPIYLIVRAIRNTSSKFLMGILAIVLLIPLLLCFVVTLFLFAEQYQFWLGLVFVMSLCSFIAASTMKKRTEEANRLLAELKGFKQFIKTAEKDQLEMLLQQDPEYYYAILPYAQTLQVTRLWQDKFKEIEMQPPTWYINTSQVFVVHDFNRFVQTMSKSATAYATPPASSGSSSSSSGISGGSGGFSGGGSSGGGAGGGGSRGW